MPAFSNPHIQTFSTAVFQQNIIMCFWRRPQNLIYTFSKLHKGFIAGIVCSSSECTTALSETNWNMSLISINVRVFGRYTLSRLSWMGRGQSCCFCLGGPRLSGQWKGCHPSSSGWHVFSYFRRQCSLCLFLLSLCVWVCVCVISGPRVNDVQPPLFLPKMKKT